MAHRLDGESAQALAQGLGWLSLGLGLAEVVAPQHIARFLGMEDRAGLIRLYGVREIATGMGILAQDDPTPWLWGRVGGDALDLATLAAGLKRANSKQQNVGLAIAAVAGVMAMDVFCARALRAASEARRRRTRRQACDYSVRRGLPRPPSDMRGAARDFPVPRDMRTPEAMRPYGWADPPPEDFERTLRPINHDAREGP
jgi:hypothetical protein